MEVIVVGAGIVGASLAYHLAPAAGVTIVDAGWPGSGTGAGAGIISPATESSRPASWFPLAYASAAYFPNLLEELGGTTSSNGYAAEGGMYVAFDEPSVGRIETLHEFVLGQETQGAPGVGSVEMIDGAAARGLFPALREPLAALHLSGMARVNGARLRQSLLEAARRRGARVEQGEATVVWRAGRVQGVELGGARKHADAVVVASGAWAPLVEPALGMAWPLTPQRGQILHLDLPRHDVSGWPVVHGEDHYLVPFAPHRVLVGATHENDVGYEARATAAGLGELIGDGLGMAPGLAPASFVEVRAGLRPMAPDGLPLLGPAPGVEGLFIASGFAQTGLTAGPFSGAALSDLVLGKPPRLDLGPFDPGRFAGRPAGAVRPARG